MRLARLVPFALLVASCANVTPTNPAASPAPLTTATAPPTAVTSEPAIACDGLPESDCRPAANAAVQAVRSHGLPERIELGPYTICLREAQTCPLPLPPENGRWVGYAVVSFQGGADVARLNVSEAGGRYEAVLIGYVQSESPTAGP